MHATGRFLQLLGLAVVPMALFFYFGHRGEASEATLMFAEMAILAAGAGVFLLGNYLVRRRSG